MYIPVDNSEDYEQDIDESVGISRGLGDPDAHGYPGEDINQEGVDPDATIETTDAPF